MDAAIFAERLKQARKRAGISQLQLSKLSGVGQNTISGYENEKGQSRLPSLVVAAALADALNVSLDWLCGRPESEEILKEAPEQAEKDKIELFMDELIDLLDNGCLLIEPVNNGLDSPGYHTEWWTIRINPRNSQNSIEAFDLFCETYSRNSKAYHTLAEQLGYDDAAVITCKASLREKTKEALSNFLSTDYVEEFPF